MRPLAVQRTNQCRPSLENPRTKTLRRGLSMAFVYIPVPMVTLTANLGDLLSARSDKKPIRQSFSNASASSTDRNAGRLVSPDLATNVVLSDRDTKLYKPFSCSANLVLALLRASEIAHDPFIDDRDICFFTKLNPECFGWVILGWSQISYHYLLHHLIGQ